ncbi:SDR family NAD(P)-dependent oxidoreductase [Halorubrum vacuolatum]|uniref:3-oxoacyl-[acyl-carrier-protein] reductase n=1 Tax=Halorubrum vacuolatum TaxID=63740 RepID=A0A238XP69_HALVU|nr:glucose 1-dehydrogenase [Halorubrum vacuolatum]SNR60826.1 3-oxoacyl-[acyl-carrier-protein] reductase [Halorubrum vacuolatum]
MKVDIEDRVALVTGAGRGNGRAIARSLARNGAKVVVNDLDEEPAEETVDTIRNEGGTAVAAPADISDENAVKAIVEEAENKFGTIDILVNNAGAGAAQPFIDERENALWRFNIETDLWGSIYCIKHVMDGMIEQNYGKIINTTSIHTKNGVAGTPQYDVGKFSVLGLTKSLALELGRAGIRVNAVAPGHTKTRMTEDFPPDLEEEVTGRNPLGRFGESEEIADAVTFLASPASDYVNGHELRVDGGQQPVDML